MASSNPPQKMMFCYSFHTSKGLLQVCYKEFVKSENIEYSIVFVYNPEEKIIIAIYGICSMNIVNPSLKEKYCCFCTHLDNDYKESLLKFFEKNTLEEVHYEICINIIAKPEERNQKLCFEATKNNVFYFHKIE